MYGGVFMLVMLLLGLLRSPWAVLLPVLLATAGPLFAAPAIAWAIVTGMGRAVSGRLCDPSQRQIAPACAASSGYLGGVRRPRW